MRLRRWLSVALLLVAWGLLPMSGFASPSKAVEGSAQRAFDAWLAAHNSGERNALEAFNAAYKVTADVQVDLDFRESVGALQLLEIRSASPVSIEALVLSEWGNALLTRIAVKAGDAFDLDLMEFENVPTPARYRPAPMELEALKIEITRRLDALEAEGKISGNVLLAHDGIPFFEWSGGWADREASIPVSASTRFRMASLGKMMTAVAILQLAETGRLSLDDPLSRHLVDYPNPAVASAVTLRQLLNHTSGLGDIFSADFPKISASLRTHRDHWDAFASTPLEFVPGTRDRYSNYGYVLLGPVIEAVTGRSYYDHVEQAIHAPAAMTSTGAEPESVPVADRAHAYTRTGGQWTRETASLPWRGTAAGGGYTTVQDLMRFATALTDGTLLSAQSLHEATRPQNVKAWYGYGFMVSGEGADRQFGHEGGAPGSNALLNVKPQQGSTAVGLSNFDPSTMANIVNFATRRMP